jgi:serine/threonine protein kinase
MTEVVSSELVYDAGPPYDDTLPKGSVIGKYIIERVLGRGGGGVVYAATATAAQVEPQAVAIKVLRTEMACYPSMVTRFLREAEAVQAIRHPNIIQIFEIGELAPRQPFYVMELLEGTDLRKLLQVQGRLSARELLELLDPICRAVGAAHDAGIVHRDIKANNVVVVEAVGNGERVVKLLDFGIAKMIGGEQGQQGLTEPGAMLGTAHNMAPEQIRCERLDGRVDIYALGVLIYQLLTGQYPFHADDPRQVALLHLQAPAPRPSALAAVPPALDAVVLKCLEKRADKRFASAAELLSALRAAVGEAAPEPAERSQLAVGVYLSLEGDPDQDPSDEAFEDMGNVLDCAEQTLSAAGFSFPLHTSTALLGVRLAVDDGAVEQRAVEALVAELGRLLATREGKIEEVRVSLSYKLGQAMCRVSGATQEVTGGPLLDLSTWYDANRSGAL